MGKSLDGSESHPAWDWALLLLVAVLAVAAGYGWRMHHEGPELRGHLAEARELVRFANGMQEPDTLTAWTSWQGTPICMSKGQIVAELASEEVGD